MDCVALKPHAKNEAELIWKLMVADMFTHKTWGPQWFIAFYACPNMPSSSTANKNSVKFIFTLEKYSPEERKFLGEGIQMSVYQALDFLNLLIKPQQPQKIMDEAFLSDHPLPQITIEECSEKEFCLQGASVACSSKIEKVHITQSIAAKLRSIAIDVKYALKRALPFGQAEKASCQALEQLLVEILAKEIHTDFQSRYRVPFVIRVFEDSNIKDIQEQERIRATYLRQIYKNNAEFDPRYLEEDFWTLSRKENLLKVVSRGAKPLVIRRDLVSRALSKESVFNLIQTRVVPILASDFEKYHCSPHYRFVTLWTRDNN